MKILYYFTLTLSAVILAIYLLSGGLFVFSFFIEEGFYTKDTMEMMFNKEVDGTLLFFNRCVAVLLFGSSLFCVLLPFLPLKAASKYKASIVILTILLCIIIIPKIISWVGGYEYY